MEKALHDIFGDDAQLHGFLQQAMKDQEKMVSSSNDMEKKTPYIKMDHSIKKVSNEEELRARIQEAKDTGKKLRVVGGNHSVPEAIEGNTDEKEQTLLIVLTGDYRKMTLANDDGILFFTSVYSF